MDGAADPQTVHPTDRQADLQTVHPTDQHTDQLTDRPSTQQTEQQTKKLTHRRSNQQMDWPIDRPAVQKIVQPKTLVLKEVKSAHLTECQQLQRHIFFKFFYRQNQWPLPLCNEAGDVGGTRLHCFEVFFCAKSSAGAQTVTAAEKCTKNWRKLTKSSLKNGSITEANVRSLAISANIYCQNSFAVLQFTFRHKLFSVAHRCWFDEMKWRLWLTVV